MGKNQQHKAMQKGRGEEGDPTETLEEGGVDVSFHSAEWHAARIAALTTERLNWEDWKKQQKEIAAKAQLAQDEEDRQMQEYRAQLDADRNARLAQGTNNAHLLHQDDKKKSKKKKSDKHSKKSKKEKKRKHKRKSSTSESSSSDSDVSHKKKKRRRKEKLEEDKEKRKPKNARPKDTEEGPIRLSDFLKS